MTFSEPNIAALVAADRSHAALQIAALCWRVKRGKLEVLLITSRDTGRWVLPKGWPMEGRDPHDAAAVEAWQEAGVQGEVSDAALGVFHYDKLHIAQAAQHCEVTVYPLRVKRLAPKFPERKQRRRKWFSAAKAAKSVAEVGLSGLILRAQATLLPVKGA
jgi:8-oxo-dGTP pyrophosphatase MutT (NUDIX family)